MGTWYNMKNMYEDMSHFCTSLALSYPFSVNFGRYEVTPFTYRHLLLKTKRTGVPPVFWGQTALHESKEKATYRKVVTAVISSCPRFAVKA